MRSTSHDVGPVFDVCLQGMSYDRTWAGPFFEETASLAYFVIVGYRFRPAADNNEYLEVRPSLAMLQSLPRTTRSPGSFASVPWLPCRCPLRMTE